MLANVTLTATLLLLTPNYSVCANKCVLLYLATAFKITFQQISFGIFSKQQWKESLIIGLKRMKVLLSLPDSAVTKKDVFKNVDWKPTRSATVWSLNVWRAFPKARKDFVLRHLCIKSADRKQTPSWSLYAVLITQLWSLNLYQRQLFSRVSVHNVCHRHRCSWCLYVCSFYTFTFVEKTEGLRFKTGKLINIPLSDWCYESYHHNKRSSTLEDLRNDIKVIMKIPQSVWGCEKMINCINCITTQDEVQQSSVYLFPCSLLPLFSLFLEVGLSSGSTCRCLQRLQPPTCKLPLAQMHQAQWGVLCSLTLNIKYELWWDWVIFSKDLHDQ